MRTLVSVFVMVFALLVAVPAADAQTAHAAPQSALDAAVQQKVATSTEDRELVRRLLDRPEVQAIAADAGLDLRRALDAVATLDDEEIATIAAQARQAEDAFAGGQSRVTISTTLIIIVLLIIILLVVAID